MAGEPKNSLPLTGRESLEYVHSIAVAPFYGDTVRWREITQNVLASSAGARFSVIPSQKVDAAAAGMARDLQAAGPQSRGDLLAGVGRQIDADAVVNGVILWKETPELIIQVISSRDGRVLYWQAADFTMKDVPPSDGPQQLIRKMLGPVVDNAGRKERPLAASPKPEVETQPKAEVRQDAGQAPRPEPPQKHERKQKPDKRKGAKPSPADEDVSPM